MNNYEKLGVFYLGREYNAEQKTPGNNLVLFDSRNFVTHGMVVGMTGSGKTGLCFDIIEEAAIDQIPAILIDPKGDLANLLLTFPNLKPEDFAPWINEDDARKQGKSLEQFAAEQAELWRKGLAKWEQDGARIQKLRDAAEFAVYTPGSSAGLPVSLLKSFSATPQEILEDMELINERASSTVAGLLGLAGIQADAVTSRESVFLSNLLLNAWKEGRDLDLAGLIQEIQQPRITKLGVLDLETFYPAADRFGLAMRLNNLLASPNFAAWMQGEPLEVGKLLWTAQGKPRVAIFSIAHLGDSERMFFVTLLLNQVLGWMRAQSGTGSLRALVYMDEIFGYFPPVANPPSKLPLLSLLKQGRAFGVGVVLATQNPVDLDYKGLANIGTWFIGRLQTERDKLRVLEGLEGAMTGRGIAFNRAETDRLISSLGSRIFLLYSVHEEGFRTFESRWAMSYLRGPLSRAQIKSLMSTSGAAAPLSRPAVPNQQAPAVWGAPRPGPDSVGAVQGRGAPPAPGVSRPVVPPQVPQYFVPARAPGQVSLVYVPKLLGAALVRYADPKLKVDTQQELVALADIEDTPIAVDWTRCEEIDLAINDLEKAPGVGEFQELPPSAVDAKNYAKWTKDFSSWIYGGRVISLLRSECTGLVSKPGEEQRDFIIRAQQVMREQKDAANEQLRAKYAPKLAGLQEKIRRAQASREKEASQAQRAKMDTLVSFGSTLLGAFLGRKAISTSTMGRAASTVRSAGRSMDQSGDVARAQETVAALEKQLADLDEQFHAEVAEMTASFEHRSTEISTLELRPKKTDIQVRLVALVWLPHTRQQDDGLAPAF